MLLCGESIKCIKKNYTTDKSEETALREGIILHDNTKKLASTFIKAIALHRFWDREKPRKVPA